MMFKLERGGPTSHPPPLSGTKTQRSESVGYTHSLERCSSSVLLCGPISLVVEQVALPEPEQVSQVTLIL